MNARKWMSLAAGVAGMAVAWCGPGTARAAEPLWLGEEEESVAVLALIPGDEVVYAGGVLQECVGLDVPVKVYLFTTEASAAQAATDALEALELPPDTLVLLDDAVTQLAPALAAQSPTLVVVSPELAEPASPLHEAMAGLPPALVLAGIAPGETDREADMEFELVEPQQEAKEAALAAYDLGGAEAQERFQRVQLAPAQRPQPPAAALPMPAPAPAPAADLPPATPARLQPAGAPPPPAPAPTPGPQGKRLVPRTHLPPPPVDRGDLDDLVIW